MAYGTARRQVVLTEDDIRAFRERLSEPMGNRLCFLRPDGAPLRPQRHAPRTGALAGRCTRMPWI